MYELQSEEIEAKNHQEVNTLAFYTLAEGIFILSRSLQRTLRDIRPHKDYIF